MSSELGLKTGNGNIQTGNGIELRAVQGWKFCFLLSHHIFKRTLGLSEQYKL